MLAVQTGGDNDNPAIKLDASSGDDDEIQIVGGTNVTVTRDSDSQITITSTDTNTQLSTEEVQDIVGGMVSGGTETNISVTYDDANNRLDFVATDTNTTYGISVEDGDNSSEEKIRLSGTNPTTTDDVVIGVSTGLTIAKDFEKIILSHTGSAGPGFVNIEDFGDMQSSTNVTSDVGTANVNVINNAIAALGTLGGTVFIPGGTYFINAAISLGNSNNGIRFVGAGHQNFGGSSDTGGAVLKRTTDGEFFNITNTRAVHFEGITFKGGNSNGGNSGTSGGTGATVCVSPVVIVSAGCSFVSPIHTSMILSIRFFESCRGEFTGII